MSVVVKITTRTIDPAGVLRKYHLEPGGAAQIALENAVIGFSIPYCPFDTGVLANSPFSATRRGSGVIRYPGPYAHYQYFGMVYGPNIPVFEDDSGVPTRWFSPPGQKKHPTGKSLTYKQDQNPDAGPFWIERMLADRRKDLLEVVKNAAGIK